MASLRCRVLPTTPIIKLPNYPITRFPDSPIPRYSSTVASSMSMTGISSLIGYTRLHVAHLSAVSFLTSLTGVLQLGQARISSSSGSMAMVANSMTARRFCGTIYPMKLGVLLVFLAGSVFAAEPAQSGRQNRGAPAAASASSAVAEAYDQFMLGLRSERDDNVE